MCALGAERGFRAPPTNSGWFLFRFIVLSLVLISAGSMSSAREIRSLVTAQKSAVALIDAVDMQIDVYRTHFRGKRLADEIHLATWRWSRKGALDRERWVQHLGYPPSKDKLPQNLGDLIENQDENQVKVLLNWDPKSPQKLAFRRQGTVRAWFAPTNPWLPPPFPNPAGQFGLLHIQANLNDARRDLEELLRESPSANVIGKAMVGGHETWKIEVEHPDTRNKGQFAGTRYEIFFDPSMNYMIREIISHIPDADPSPDTIVPVRIEREVLEFKDAGNGAFLPTLMSARLYDASNNQLAENQRLVASKIVVNGTLPVDALNFEFPEDARVTEMPAVDGIFTIHLWGPDNKAIRQIRDYSEITGVKAVAPGGGYLRIFLFLGNVVAILVVTVILIRRRRRLSRL